MATDLPATVNLAAYHGDTWAQTFRLKHDAIPVDLTGATIECWARGSELTLPLVVTITDALAGEFQLTFPPEGVPAGGYTFDVEVQQAGIVTTWIRGALAITADITNAPPAPASRYR